MRKRLRLDARQLRSVCDPATFEFASTADIEPLDEVIGQRRAVQAIDFGLNMHSPGYNIFITGLDGTGRTTIVRDIVSRHARGLPSPLDWCLVNNFQDEYRPRAIALPTGKAGMFSRQVNRLIRSLTQRLPQVFEEDDYQEKKKLIQQRFAEGEQKLLSQLESDARERQLAISKNSSGYQAVPLKDGQPMTREDFDALPEEQRRKIEDNIKTLLESIEATMAEIGKSRQQMHYTVEELNARTALFVVHQRLVPLLQEYADQPQVMQFLDTLQRDIIDHVEQFLPGEQSRDAVQQLLSRQEPDILQRYAVNVLVEHNPEAGAPVVYEPNPSYPNVFGWIEKRAQMGAVTTDFTMVQAGSMLRADGGFLIMEIESLLANPAGWAALKRTLQNKQLYIEDGATMAGMAAASLRPQPIDIDVKVILIGGYSTFELLQNHDPKFNKIFKVRADFDHEVIRSKESVNLYARFIARVCREEKLIPFSPHGVAAIVEFGEKMIAHQKKLSLRFGPVVGIIKEAEYWARKDGAETVTDRHVVKAFNEYRFRYNLYEEKIHESYTDKTILVDVDGSVVGQVNALAVYQMGDIAFGRPSRITAETYMGKQGVINVEREARLSGQTHDKGVLILAGYLGRTFAQRQPLSLSISITFEQSYAGIDGDSASSTELYAILSSLSGAPVDQGIAVTGSVNQKGQIQAIGGVNQKIEGFFDVCLSRGLTGRQGVMIPSSNKKNLMLKKAVVDAVAAGQFHIYSVDTVEQGIEILTGQPAGKPDDRGIFADNTVFGKAQHKLEAFLRQALKWNTLHDVM